MTRTNLRYLLGYLIGGTLFLVVIPGVLILASRWLDHHVGLQLVPIPGLRIALALILALTGLAFAFWSGVVQYIVGQGGPLEVADVAVSPQTQRLVVTGPYRYTRNPMLFGAVTLYLGIAVYLSSLVALALVVLWAAFMLSVVVPSEERRLLRDFGSEYEAYRCRVSRFIPWRSKP